MIIVLTPNAVPPRQRISLRFKYLPFGGFFQKTLIFAGRVLKNSFRSNLGLPAGALPGLSSGSVAGVKFVLSSMLPPSVDALMAR